MKPIDDDCDCSTCQTYTRSYLHHIVTVEAVACSLLSIHNVYFQVRLRILANRRLLISIYFQLRLMRDIREAIKQNKFPEFVKTFMAIQYSDVEVPTWIRDALRSVNIIL